MVKIYGIDIQDVDELIFGDDERVGNLRNSLWRSGAKHGSL